MSTLYDKHITGDDTAYYAYGSGANAIFMAQTFTPSVNYSINFVKLLLYRSGLPDDITVSIQGVNGSSHPDNIDIDGVTGVIDGNALTENTAGEWKQINLSAGISLSAGTTYAIVVKALTGVAIRKVHWRADYHSGYPHGRRNETNNGGDSWTDWDSIDFIFECWGTGGLGFLVLNTFIGKLFGWNLRYSEEWSTDLVTYDTGKEQRNQIWERPKRHWVLPYNALITTYRNKLKELCSRAKGIYNVFLFEDPYDYECALTECVITAVAEQVNFQLIKTYYVNETEKWDENKTRIQPSGIFQPVIKVDDEEKTEGVDYELNDDTGIVTFGAAPGALAEITANYQFYYPVRKEDDAYEETTIASGTWNMGDIPIVEVIE